MKNIMKIITIWGVATTLISGVMSVHAQAAEPTKAVAVLHPTQGNTATGTVSFLQTDQGVRVAAEVTGLTPGLHGFHIHQFGDCSAPDGTSAGGHFNPTAKQHAGPDAAQRHAGDFGNMEADNTGSARYDRVDSHIRLSGPDSIIGRGVIIHAQADDLVSQPTGNAGARVACGAIGITKE
ncbi:MAG: superoxide dismutase family protein [Thermodesulfobacteriota bacterium]